MAKSFYSILIIAGPVLALLLQALVLSRFLNRGNRDYPLAILFTLILFPLTVFAFVLNKYPNLIPITLGFTTGYAAADLCMHILLLALMLQLIRQTLLQLGQTASIVWALGGVSALVSVSAYLFFESDFARTRQVVSFWMVLLNLFWWTLLLRKRKVDRRVMLLSTGIGLMMTGQVIADGIEILAMRKDVKMLIAAYLIIYLTHYICLYCWFSAFKTPKIPEVAL